MKAAGKTITEMFTVQRNTFHCIRLLFYPHQKKKTQNKKRRFPAPLYMSIEPCTQRIR